MTAWTTAERFKNKQALLVEFTQLSLFFGQPKKNELDGKFSAERKIFTFEMGDKMGLSVVPVQYGTVADRTKISCIISYNKK